MALVSAKCPNCGATIQLDSSKKEGYCLYCGSKVRVQDAIKIIKVDRSGNIGNYLNMAKAAIEAHNGNEALEYSNKVLEIDSENAVAWYLKMQSVQINTDVYTMKIEEILTVGGKAITYSKDAEMKTKVYAFYLDTCCYDLGLCIKESRDDADGFYGFKEEFYILCGKIIKKYSSIESYILSLRKAVPEDAIANSEELQDHTRTLANQWKDYVDYMVRSYENKGKFISYTTMKSFPSQLELIQQGLPEEEKIRFTDKRYFVDIDPESLDANRRKSHKYAVMLVIFDIVLLAYAVFNHRILLSIFFFLLVVFGIIIVFATRDSVN